MKYISQQNLENITFIIHEEKRFFLFYWPLSQNPQCLAQCSLMFSEFLQGSEILFCLMYPIQSSSVSIGWNPSSLGHSGMCMQSTGIYANQVEYNNIIFLFGNYFDMITGFNASTLCLVLGRVLYQTLPAVMSFRTVSVATAT